MRNLIVTKIFLKVYTCTDPYEISRKTTNGQCRSRRGGPELVKGSPFKVPGSSAAGQWSDLNIFINVFEIAERVA